MSWPPALPSEAQKNVTRVRTSGLPTFLDSPAEQLSQSSERLRLPPLSTLISGSSFTATASPPLPSHSSHNASSRTEWSPLSSLNAPPSVSRTSPISDRFHGKFQSGDSLPGLYPLRNQNQQHHQPEQPRRTNATSSAATPSVSLPPLTSLSIHSSTQSPSLSLPFTGGDSFAPRLPSTSSSSYTYSNSNPSEPRKSRMSDSPSSSSSMPPGYGPTRRRWAGSVSARPYDRPASPSDHEYFGHVSTL